MSTPIVMPKQGQSVESCVIVEWKKKQGDTVAKGDVLFNFETDKAAFDFESPAAGILLAVFYNENDDVPVLNIVGVIGEPDENFDLYRPQVKKETIAVQPTEHVPSKVEPQTASQSYLVATENTGHAASPRAKKTAEKHGVDITRINGSGPHGRIIERDVLSAPALSKTAWERKNTEDLSAPGLGTGIGGMIRSVDLVKQTQQESTLQSIPEGYTEIKQSNIRKLIGSRMLQSLQESAQLTMNTSADATSLLDYRKKLKTAGTTSGLADITVTDIIVMTVARTLPDFPELNSLYKDNRLFQYKNVHLALAIDTARGLMVPVIKSCNELSLAAISKTIKDHATKCREGSINPDLLNGGTFTITNLGMFGIESFTPVLNPPQVAILGINTITPKPFKTRDDTYEIRSSIGFSLTIDHRVVDGAPGARFLKVLCDSIASIQENMTKWSV